MKATIVTPSLHRGEPSSTIRPALHRPSLGSRRRGVAPATAALLDAHQLSQALALGYEAVVLPCSRLSCGDLITRGSLDPVLRMEQHFINPDGVALLAVAAGYLLAKPGVLQGAWDHYVQAPLQRLGQKAFRKDDFEIVKKLGSGGFGTAYSAELADPETGQKRRVVMKRADEFGEAECWMNERMSRAAPGAAAEFITAFSDGDSKAGAPLWLVWAYEGDSTLADLLKSKDFPANVEPLLFGRPLRIPPSPARRAAVIRVVLQQLLECLQACHRAGIVHRDVKPQNVIFSEAEGRMKLIDFGAAADLRIGINYVPSQYLLDERYAPPQKYIMDKFTPRAPPKPLAALLSPALWALFHPDRFDMYSVGITLLQMAFPGLRSDSGLSAFRKQLSKHKYDLRQWRAALGDSASAKEWAEGLGVLDCDDGAGWDLACSLIQYRPQDRLSCSAALAHRWFSPPPLTGLASALSMLTRQGSIQASRGMRDWAHQEAGWLEDRMASAYDGRRESGIFSEAQLADEELAGGGELEAPQHASATIAWWQDRQAHQQAKLSHRPAQHAGSLAESAKRDGGGSGSNGSSKGNKRKKLLAVAMGGGRSMG